MGYDDFVCGVFCFGYRLRLGTLIVYGTHGKEKRLNISLWLIFGIVMMNGAHMVLVSQLPWTTTRPLCSTTCLTSLLFKFSQAIRLLITSGTTFNFSTCFCLFGLKCLQNGSYWRKHLYDELGRFLTQMFLLNHSTFYF